MALQLLMKTDGTVTELIKLLSNEDLIVIKLSGHIEDGRILRRRIFLQGKSSRKNWLYAESEIFLDKLPQNFVNDLIENNLPIGTLWTKYRMETFKQLVKQSNEVTETDTIPGFSNGVEFLTRTYEVFNSANLIMRITEKFPVEHFQKLIWT